MVRARFGAAEGYLGSWDLLLGNIVRKRAALLDNVVNGRRLKVASKLYLLLCCLQRNLSRGPIDGLKGRIDANIIARLE